MYPSSSRLTGFIRRRWWRSGEIVADGGDVPMAMEPSISMTTSEGEREAATPSPYEKTRSGTLPQGRNTI